MIVLKIDVRAWEQSPCLTRSYVGWELLGTLCEIVATLGHHAFLTSLCMMVDPVSC